MFVPQLPLSHGCFAVPVLPEGTAAEIRCSRAGSGVWALMQSGQTSQTVSQAEYYLFRQGNENQQLEDWPQANLGYVPERLRCL